MTALTPMQIALQQAELAAKHGEVPIGAVVVNRASGEIAATAYNLTETWHDPTAHAEMLALRDACRKIGAPRLPGFDLYVTLEPCAMCAAAISLFRPDRVYFGAYDPKGGGVEHGPKFFAQPTCHHRPEVYGGINEAEAAKLLKDFFEARR